MVLVVFYHQHLAGWPAIEPVVIEKHLKDR